MFLGERRVGSRMTPREEGSARKTSLCRCHCCILQQQQMPAKYSKDVLGWSHPSRKSSTGMASSILWQLGELLDEATDVIPVFKNILNMVFRVPYLVREDMNEKKTFSFVHCPNEGGGLPMPEFLALFQEMHFWSIKRVYFFKNANVLNF